MLRVSPIMHPKPLDSMLRGCSAIKMFVRFALVKMRNYIMSVTNVTQLTMPFPS